MLKYEYIHRREFLKFLGRTSSAVTVASWITSPAWGRAQNNPKTTAFQELPATQSDAVVLPEGFTYQKLIDYGVKLNKHGDVFGYNNDYLCFCEISGSPNEGILWVNHEYPDPLFVSGWNGKSPRTKEQVIKEQKAVGGSLIKVRKKNGVWEFVPNDPYNRRISAKTEIPLNSARPISGTTKAIGTLGNCAGGKTSWGTVLTCEENYDKFYGEMDYTAPHPKIVRHSDDYRWADFFNYSPEHYGWVVEVNPMTGAAEKLCALGRFAHECATCTVAPDQRTVTYMGDDAANQFIYKFIAAEPGNLKEGILYAADTKNGRWLALDWSQDTRLKAKFKDQTEVLIRAREAAALLGATPQNRPEDVEIDPATGSILVAVTNNKKQGDYFGGILRIQEKDNDPRAMEFKASMFLAGGPNTGFACPDNMAFDKKGNLWFTVDVSETELNKGRYDVFGNNSLFYVPMNGHGAGRPMRFASAPYGAEFTGPTFSPDGNTLFLSVQHPGEGTVDVQNCVSHWPDGGTTVPRPAVITIDVSRLM